jgi:tetratricopeptide (TPR) repeat protein
MSQLKIYFRIGICFMVIIAAYGVSAQSLEEAKALYNQGGEAVQGGNLELGVEKFAACIEMCETLVDEEEDMEAEELMLSVQQNVPKLYYQIGMDKIKSNDIDGGLDNLYKARETAEYYSDSDILDKTTKVLPQIHYKLGANAYKSENFEASLADLDKAIAVDPDYANAYYLKAVVYKSQDKDDLLISTARKAIEAANASNDIKTRDNTSKLAGGHFLKKGNDAKAATNYADAIKFLDLSLEFENNNPTTHYLLTSIYVSQQNWDKAIAAANEGLKYEEGTTKARFYYELGNAHYGKGDKAGACEAYSKAAVGDYIEHANYQMEQVVKCNE